MNEPKRLYRSRKDQQISGVCAGLAQYFAVDVTWVRVAFVLLALFNGGGVLLYIVLSIVLPVEPSESTKIQGNLEQTLREGAQNLGERAKELSEGVRGGRNQYLGWGLVGVGIWFLLNQLGWIRINEDFVFPLILIGIGVLVLMRRGGST